MAATISIKQEALTPPGRSSRPNRPQPSRASRVSLRLWGGTREGRRVSPPRSSPRPNPCIPAADGGTRGSRFGTGAPRSMPAREGCATGDAHAGPEVPSLHWVPEIRTRSEIRTGSDVLAPGLPEILASSLFPRLESHGTWLRSALLCFKPCVLV